jgi:hypothetical protein
VHSRASAQTRLATANAPASPRLGKPITNIKNIVPRMTARLRARMTVSLGGEYQR